MLFISRELLVSVAMPVAMNDAPDRIDDRRDLYMVMTIYRIDMTVNSIMSKRMISKIHGSLKGTQFD